MFGRKSDLGIALALQHLFVHLLVARMIAALAAGGIHNDFAAGVSGLRIESNAATLQLEGAMDGVQHVSQRPLDFGLGGIKINCNLLCRHHRRQQQQPGEQGDTDTCATFGLNELETVPSTCCSSDSSRFYAASKCHPRDTVSRKPKFKGEIAPGVKRQQPAEVVWLRCQRAKHSTTKTGMLVHGQHERGHHPRKTRNATVCRFVLLKIAGSRIASARAIA